MKLQGSHRFPVPPAELWPLLIDPAILTAVLPGCQELTPIAENQYKGILTIEFGPMAGTYTGNLSLSHIVENEGYTFTFTAQSKTGTIGGNGRLQLQPQENNTLLSYEGEAKVGGQLATHATALLETTARSLARQSLENLDRYTYQGKIQTLSEAPDIPNELDSPSGNIFGGQQTTIIIITALTTITMFALFYFFNRKLGTDS
jgi:uncharacterized protein